MKPSYERKRKQPFFKGTGSFICLLLSCLLLTSCSSVVSSLTPETSSEASDTASTELTSSSTSGTDSSESPDSSSSEPIADASSEVSSQISDDASSEVSGNSSGDDSSAEAHMEVHFLDVGQGLSILAMSEDEVLIYDGGDRSSSDFVVSYLKKQGVEKIDYLISSHYDSDHVSGLIGCLNVFDVETVIGADYVHNSSLYESFQKAVTNKDLTVTHPKVGTSYNFGTGTFTILSPDTTYSDSNNNSVAIKLTNGDTDFIFMGDAESESESAMISSGIDLSCDVLCLGHHGSASSTSWDLLQASVPEFAIISCGADNAHGHPHEETMEKLSSMEIPVFRTDMQGTITAVSDGSSIEWNVQPCNDYSSGEDSETETSESTDTTDSEKSSESSKNSSSDESSESSKNSSSDKSSESSKNSSSDKSSESSECSYILNTSTEKFHLPGCRSVKQMSDKNKKEYTGTRDDLIDMGYEPCKNCNP